MTRYFLHLYSDLEVLDVEGVERNDDREVVEFAVNCARDIASADVREGHLDLQHSIVCVAEDGREVRTISFADAVLVATRRSD